MEWSEVNKADKAKQSRKQQDLPANHKSWCYFKLHPVACRSFSQSIGSDFFSHGSMTEPLHLSYSAGGAEQDEELEGEGDHLPRDVDVFSTPIETKYWKIQTINSADPSPKWRNCHTAVMQDDSKMIIFGGLHRKTKLNDCWWYDVELNEWREIKAGNAPSPRYCHTASLYKNQYMIIFGGLGDRGERYNDLAVLDLANQEWTRPITMGVPPEPRSHHGAALFGERLIIFGGLSGVSAERLNSIHILELDKRPWTWTHPQTIGTPPTGRLYPTLTVWKNQLAIFAGYTGKHRLNDIHFLDLGTLTWSEPWTNGYQRPDPVYGHTGTQLGSKLLVFGGNTGVSYYERHVYMLDMETMEWKRLQNVDCPNGRRYHTSVLSLKTEKIYVYGGSTITKIPEDFLYVLDTSMIPGMEEWTFDEAKDIIHQGIRAFSKNRLNLTPSSSSSSAFDTPRKDKSKLSSSGSANTTVTSIPISSSPSSSSGRKRKKSRGESEEKSLVHSNSSSTLSPGKENVSLTPDSATVEEQVAEALRLLKLHFRRLKTEKESLRAASDELQEQKQQFEIVRNKMKALEDQSANENVVKLSVGGCKFQTTLATLTSNQDSMLAAMFSGRYKLPKDSKGRVFIDRDGTHFRYILNFLRDGTLNTPLDHILLLDLLQEAQFYQLHKLVQLIKVNLSKTLPTQLHPGHTISGQNSARTRLSAAHRALSMSELRDSDGNNRAGTSPDFDDYWGNL